MRYDSIILLWNMQSIFKKTRIFSNKEKLNLQIKDIVINLNQSKL